jgi:hypothetical protein
MGVCQVAPHFSGHHEDDLPTRRPFGSIARVPDFSRIPRDRWAEVMRTIPHRLRFPAAQGLALPPDQAAELVDLAMSRLPPAPSDRARAAVLANPRITPAGFRRRGRIADRQVSFRITDEEYLELATAAELVGVSPTKLATTLVRSGVERVIEEANRPGG